MPHLLSHPSSLLLGIWSPGFAVIISVKYLTLIGFEPINELQHLHKTHLWDLISESCFITSVLITHSIERHQFWHCFKLDHQEQSFCTTSSSRLTAWTLLSYNSVSSPPSLRRIDWLNKQTKKIAQAFLTDWKTVLQGIVPSVIKCPPSKDTHDQLMLWFS